MFPSDSGSAGALENLDDLTSSVSLRIADNSPIQGPVCGAQVEPPESRLVLQAGWFERGTAGLLVIFLVIGAVIQNDLNARLGRARQATVAPGQVAASDDRVARLTKLAALRENGMLSADEFEREKQRILTT